MFTSYSCVSENFKIYTCPVFLISKLQSMKTLYMFSFIVNIHIHISHALAET
jgi:hypothetical protein